MGSSAQTEFRFGPYDKAAASRLKIQSGNFPGHGEISAPPPGAREGLSLLDGDRWIGFVELTYPYASGKISKDYAYIGAGLLPEYRGKGLAEKAVRELLRRYPQITRWKWSYAPWNEASAALGARLGFAPSSEGGLLRTMEKRAGVSSLYALYLEAREGSDGRTRA